MTEFQIAIAPEDWQKMLDNMTKLYGPRGSGRGGRPGMGGVFPGAGSNPMARPSRVPGSDLGAMPMPPGGPGGGGMMGPAAKPMWVAATIRCNGRTWNKVGVRFKGNSSLRSAWTSGTDKIPFKLDFEQWEDAFPAIKNQRYHGFKQLSLSTNWNDGTSMRDAITYDLMRDSGFAAAHTGFYDVFLDRGDGKVSLGLYTAIEVIDDTVVKQHFGGDKGNIYEADGPAASLALGTADRIKTSFQKENNQEAADWGDIEGLYTVLHDPRRTTDPVAWRQALEARFDVPTFLRWLAVSAVIQHWDTYGGMTHNFYLYQNPATNRLTWISWDHNLVLGAMGGPGGPGMPPPPNGVFPAPPSNGMDFPAPPGGLPPFPGGPGGRGLGALDRKDVGANWPLIRFLLDDPTYYAAYVGYLGETVNGPFQPAAMQAKYERLGRLLAPYAAKQNDTGYQAAVQSLIQVTNERVQAVRTFLSQPVAPSSVAPS